MGRVFLFSIFLTIITLTTSNAKPIKKPPYTIESEATPLFQPLYSEFFSQLSVEKQAEYIQALRNFLIEQEKNQKMIVDYKSPFDFGIWAMLFRSEDSSAADKRNWFPDDNGRCNFVESSRNYQDGVAPLIRDGRDKCVMAGRPICMYVTDSGRLSCDINIIPGIREHLYSECTGGKIRCSGLFVMDKEGTSACVQPGPKSTKRCAEESPNGVKNFVEFLKKHPERKDQFDYILSNISSYCGSKNQANYFDTKDCEELNKRISELASELNEDVPASTQKIADCIIPKGKGPPYLKSSLRYRADQNIQKGYKVTITGEEVKNWRAFSDEARIRADHSRLANTQFQESLANEGVELSRPLNNSLEMPWEYLRLSPYSGRAQLCEMIYTQLYWGELTDNSCVVRYKNSTGNVITLTRPRKSNYGVDQFTTNANLSGFTDVANFGEMAGSTEEKGWFSTKAAASNPKSCLVEVKRYIRGTPVVIPQKPTDQKAQPAGAAK